MLFIVTKESHKLTYIKLYIKFKLYKLLNTVRSSGSGLLPVLVCCSSTQLKQNFLVITS